MSEEIGGSGVDIQDAVWRTALQNAAEHGGTTRDGVVIAKIMGVQAELRGMAGEVAAAVAPVVREVNGMTVEQQRAELIKRFPDALAEEEERGRQRRMRQEHDRQHGLPELDDVQAGGGGVVTRFPPEPNGYPHIGHAKAAIINSEYVRMYGGRRILRMDDTNPESERMEFYAAIKVGLEWLGIEYDEVKNTSDDIELIYQKGLQLVEGGRAYVCTCKREEMGRNRREMRACRCSVLGVEETVERWHRMFERFKPGEAVVRFRGDIKSDNTVMRDPVLFRVVEGEHPLLKDRYRVWPSYDLAVAVEDSVDGVTHAFRSKEYELRNELYYAILDALGMRKPRVLEFSRLAFAGMPVSKRVLKPLIEEGKVSWYDDPRLPTLEAMRRRGIRPEAIREFIMSLGFTKSDTLAPFESLEAFNRKIIDGESVRLNMVSRPARLAVAGLPAPQIEIQNHPTAAGLGSRTVGLGNGVVCIASDDCAGLEPGGMTRLMGLGNVRITRVSPGPVLEGEYAGDDTGVECPKMQWVAADLAHRIRILVPGRLFVDDEYNEDSLTEMDVMVEPHYLELADGDPIQFIRFGYCRKDSRNQAIYTHR